MTRLSESQLKRFRIVLHGGEGSGNFGHAGRPGEIGGSRAKKGAKIINTSLGNIDISSVPPLRNKKDRYFVRFSTSEEKESVGLSAYQGKNLPELIESVYPYFDRSGGNGYLLIGRGMMERGEDWQEGEEISRFLGSEYAPVEIRIPVGLGKRVAQP